MSSPERRDPILNAFTVDVEDYFHVQGYADVIRPSEWEGFESRVERNTDALLARLAEKEVRGTFFVLGWVARRHPSVVRKIAAAGHEVASHGMNHTMIYTQSPETFRTETRDGKAVLEDLIQMPVKGYRAATYSITTRSLWALSILAEEGFSYDSSIFPVRHDRYGIPRAPRWPYTVACGNGGTLVEFPLSTLGVLGYNLPVAGGGYFRLFPYLLSSFALGRLNRTGRPFIFYIHPWEIDPGQPRIATGRMATFRHRVNLARCEARIVRLLGRFRLGTALEVLERHPPALALTLEDLAKAGGLETSARAFAR
jgi:polysaccharide deacetylase family protein (PEP-CTERM system associated)